MAVVVMQIADLTNLPSRVMKTTMNAGGNPGKEIRAGIAAATPNVRS